MAAPAVAVPLHLPPPGLGRGHHLPQLQLIPRHLQPLVPQPHRPLLPPTRRPQTPRSSLVRPLPRIQPQEAPNSRGTFTSKYPDLHNKAPYVMYEGLWDRPIILQHLRRGGTVRLQGHSATNSLHIVLWLNPRLTGTINQIYSGSWPGPPMLVQDGFSLHRAPSHPHWRDVVDPDRFTWPLSS